MLEFDGMPDRTRARQLAAEYLAKNDPTGWFEQLYREAGRGETTVPWADLRPNPNLTEFWTRHPIPADGRTAIEVGCGLGDDAEQLAAWGFQTTAFDISASAIEACRRRSPRSSVHYVAADLLNTPAEWNGQFDFVLESYTLQVLPRNLRPEAIRRVASLVKPGGLLLMIARGREERDPPGEMPWPLTRSELDDFKNFGLRERTFEDYADQSESPPVRRFRAVYDCPLPTSCGSAITTEFARG
jgi:SAM-dependent methyltransferase